MNSSDTPPNFDQICLAAFKSISIRSRGDSLYVAPCCGIDPGKLTTEKLDFETHSLLEEIRDDWKNSRWHNDCKTCDYAEQNGKRSTRVALNNGIVELYHKGYATMPTTWEEVYKRDILRMDYWIGDMCNLACLTCGPPNSSLWRQILGYTVDKQKITTNRFWDQIDLSKLVDVHIHGGEPFLSKEHTEFVQAVPNKKQVNLVYNTNGTVRPNQKVFDAWKEYNHVNLHFSFDAIGKQFEYLRWPAQWDQALETFEYIMENLEHNSCIVIYMVESVLNYHYIEEFKSWWNKNYPTDKHGHPITIDVATAYGGWGPWALDDFRLDYVEKLKFRDDQYGHSWRKLFPKSIDTVEQAISRKTIPIQARG